MFRIGKIVTTEEMVAGATEVAVAPIAEDIPSDMKVWIGGAIAQADCLTTSDIPAGQILSIPCNPIPLAIEPLTEIKLSNILFFVSDTTPVGSNQIPVFDNFAEALIPSGANFSYCRIAGGIERTIARSIPARSTVLTLTKSPDVVLPIGTQIVYEADIYEPIFYLEMPIELEFEFEYYVRSLNYKVSGNTESEVVAIEFQIATTVLSSVVLDDVIIDWEIEYQITPTDYAVIWRIIDLLTISVEEFFSINF